MRFALPAICLALLGCDANAPPSTPANTAVPVTTSDPLAERAPSERGAAAPKVGDVAPMFSLADTRGQLFTLGDALAAGPVVAVFYRGDW